MVLIQQQHVPQRHFNLDLCGSILVHIIEGIKFHGLITYKMNHTDPATVDIGLYHVIGYDLDLMRVIMNDFIIWMAFEIFIFDILNTMSNICYSIAIFGMIILLLLLRMKLLRNKIISDYLLCNENEMLIIDVDDTSDRPSWSIFGIGGVFDNLQNIFLIIVTISIISIHRILFLIEIIFWKKMQKIILNDFLICMTFGIFISDTLNNTMNTIHFIILLLITIARYDTNLCYFSCSDGGILIIDVDDVSDGLSCNILGIGGDLNGFDCVLNVILIFVVIIIIIISIYNSGQQIQLPSHNNHFHKNEERNYKNDYIITWTSFNSSRVNSNTGENITWW